MTDAGLVGEQRLGEELLVLPEDDGVSLAVYLSDDVQQELVRGSLAAHCHATEGVSHFVMLLWSARQERPVRPLDLELQAEVDKASTCLLLDRAHTGGLGGAALLRRLFDGAQLDPRLDAAERSRYREAHRLAARYAWHLLDELERGVDRMLGELRSLYRLPAEGKRARLAALPAR